MEEVEAANKAAVESCHGVLNLLSQQTNDSKSIMVETREAVSKFKKVSSLLSKGLGQRKIRKLNNNNNNNFKFNASLLPQHMFLESPICNNNAITGCIPVLAPKPLQVVPPAGYGQIDTKQKQGHPPLMLLNQKMCVDKSFLELKPPPFRPVDPKPYQFIHNHQQGVYSRSNSGLNLKFDRSVGGGGSCYSPSMSNGSRSFVSSLSMDGSVADYDRNSFHLIGLPQGSDHISQHSRRTSCSGSLKCGSKSKCHCSKKRCLVVSFCSSFE